MKMEDTQTLKEESNSSSSSSINNNNNNNNNNTNNNNNNNLTNYKTLKLPKAKHLPYLLFLVITSCYERLSSMRSKLCVRMCLQYVYSVQVVNVRLF